MDKGVNPWSDYAYEVTKVKIDNKIKPKTTSCWFCGMKNLATIEGLENLDTSEVTDMSYMFAYCDLLKTLDLKTFDTSKVKYMNSMFRQLGGGSKNDYRSGSLVNLDLSSFDTSNVVDMNNMFRFFYGDELDLSSFDTSNVKDMSGMFYNYEGGENLKIHVGSKWNSDKVENKDDMFRGCIGGEECIDNSF